MKSQDIGLLLKLVALQQQEDVGAKSQVEKAWPHDWQDWQDPDSEGDKGWEGPSLAVLNIYYSLQNYIASRYTVRALAQETGISKSQINLGLNRCYEVGLAKKDRHLDVPRANKRALFDFIIYGLKYIFPAKPKELTRGIATAFAAPVLKDKLMSAGEFVLVWPDARGNTKGQSVEPLFKSATFAVRRDPQMYALLALVDAIRLGQPREANLATKLLKERLGV
ncbi:MAG: hypothetical protein OFPII_05780 [Osedax symbiont Rs1]|nr:MAG: hypothetical protein OFPII_05780 [Osedax symbiont Rs1]